MKKMIASIALFASMSAFAQTPSIYGTWKTIDDNSKEAKSLINIYEKDGKVFGKIEKLFLKPDENQNPICDKCIGENKDAPILGMELLRSFDKDSETKWSEGTITDPKSGKVYSCKIELIENGTKLKVRGYVGISLLGRTQVWERM